MTKSIEIYHISFDYAGLHDRTYTVDTSAIKYHGQNDLDATDLALTGFMLDITNPKPSFLYGVHTHDMEVDACFKNEGLVMSEAHEALVSTIGNHCIIIGRKDAQGEEMALTLPGNYFSLIPAERTRAGRADALENLLVRERMRRKHLYQDIRVGPFDRSHDLEGAFSHGLIIEMLAFAGASGKPLPHEDVLGYIINVALEKRRKVLVSEEPQRPALIGTLKSYFESRLVAWKSLWKGCEVQTLDGFEALRNATFKPWQGVAHAIAPLVFDIDTDLANYRSRHRDNENQVRRNLDPFKDRIESASAHQKMQIAKIENRIQSIMETNKAILDYHRPV